MHTNKYYVYYVYASLFFAYIARSYTRKEGTYRDLKIGEIAEKSNNC